MKLLLPGQQVSYDHFPEENKVEFGFELWVRIYIENERSKIGKKIEFLLNNNNLAEVRKIIEQGFGNDANY